MTWFEGPRHLKAVILGTFHFKQKRGHVCRGPISAHIRDQTETDWTPSKTSVVTPKRRELYGACVWLCASVIYSAALSHGTQTFFFMAELCYLVIRPLKKKRHDESARCVKPALTGLHCVKTVLGWLPLGILLDRSFVCVNYRAQDKKRWDQIKEMDKCWPQSCSRWSASSRCSWPAFGCGTKGSWFSRSPADMAIWRCCPSPRVPAKGKRRGKEKSVRAKLREHRSFSVPTDTQTCIHNLLAVSSKHTGVNSRSFQ